MTLQITQEQKDRARQLRQKRNALQDKYTPKLWGQIKQKMLSKKFPNDVIQNLLASEDKSLRISTGVHWTHDNKKHVTEKYTYYENMYFGLFGIDWSYQYCGVCGDVVKRTATLLNSIENLAEAHDYTNGKPLPYQPRGDFESFLYGSNEELVDDINAGITLVSEILDFTPENIVRNVKGGESDGNE